MVFLGRVCENSFMVGSHCPFRRGSSVVEQKTENLRVGSSILPLGTEPNLDQGP